MLAMAIVALLALACNNDKADDLCARATRHMAFGIIAPGETGQPSAEEKKIMQVVVQMSVAQCRQEGLGAAQAECIFAYQPFQGGSLAQAMIDLVECPAIAARRPSWLQMPPREVLEEMRAAERARDAGP